MVGIGRSGHEIVISNSRAVANLHTIRYDGE